MSDSAKETVLIIGGTGQIGTQVTVQELAAGHDVHVFGRSAASSRKVDFITQAANGHYTSVDINGNRQALAALIKQVNPAKIYFMAEPFPMKDEAVTRAVAQMDHFYRTLMTDVGFRGPVVVVGTAGIETTGQGFPLQTYSASDERVIGQIPYFKARRRMAETCRFYEAGSRGLDIRRVALPWVVSGDAHHADMEPLTVFATGSMAGFGMPEARIDAISGMEAARAIRFVADKGAKGWTYQAGGVPNVPVTSIIQTELTEIGGGRLKTAPSSREKLLSQASLMLSSIEMKKAVEKNPFLMGINALWEGFARAQFEIAANVSVREVQMRGATACALSAVLPARADMSALEKLGFRPTDQATQTAQVYAEARRLARLLVREGVIRKTSQPASARYYK